ncbi:MAG: hypothetical protein AB8B49_00695 [Nitratireductor sp.]
MYINDGNLADVSGIDNADCKSVKDLIESFNFCDLQLKMALETDNEQEIVRCDKQISQLIEELFNFNDLQSVSCKKYYVSFLVNKFVLPENAGQALKKRATDKIISAFD